MGARGGVNSGRGAEGSGWPGIRWHRRWRWRVEVIEVTFMNVIRQALKDIYIQTRTHGQLGTHAQTHLHTHGRGGRVSAWGAWLPDRCELTQIFLCLRTQCPFGTSGVLSCCKLCQIYV